MKGTHRVVVEAKGTRYELYIKHKFSLIMGDSGAGKSALCNFIGTGRAFAESGGVNIRTDLNPFSLNSVYELENLLKEGFNLIFIDESVVDSTFKGGMISHFGELAKKADAYFVFMSRHIEHFAFAPINVDACYNLIWEKHKKSTRVVMDNLYEWNDDSPMAPDVFIIEDSKVGYMFYKQTSRHKNECLSAYGNSNVTSIVEDAVQKGAKSIFVIADGCGFGVYFDALLRLKKVAKRQHNVDIRLFLPPSFEYLVLKSGIFRYEEDKLINTQNYALIEKYMGWEVYYTEELIKASGGEYRKNGRSLPTFFRDWRNVNKMYDTIKEIKR